MGNSYMFNFICSSWQEIKKKIHKFIPYFLSFILFLSPLTVSAANWTNWKSWVENTDENSSGWVEGTSSTNGNVKISMDIIVSEQSVQFVGSGSIGYNAGLFMPDIAINEGDVISFNISSVNSYIIGYGVKYDFDTSGLVSFQDNPVWNSEKVAQYESLSKFIGNDSISITAVADGYFFLYCYIPGGNNNGGTIDWTAYDISINGDGVNLSTEDILNKGDSYTQGIVDSATDSNDLLNSVVSDYKDIEDSMLSNFNQYQTGILSDINTWSWGGLAVCANWVGETMTSYYNNLGDFKQYIIYPLLLGIALFFIGRGSAIIGHLYRKPTVVHTDTYVTRTTTKSGNTSHVVSHTDSVSQGGVLRK